MYTSRIVVNRGSDVYELEFVQFRNPLYTRTSDYKYNDETEEWDESYKVGYEVTGIWITTKNGVRFDPGTDKDAFIIYYIGKGNFDSL